MECRRALTVTVMDPLPMVTMEVLRPELQEQRQFEVVVTASMKRPGVSGALQNGKWR